MAYSAAFRASMIKKMTGRGAITATALSNETGVSQATLSRWKREASSVLEVPKDKPTDQPEPKRAQDWTPEEKLRAVVETSGLSEPELGSYLRRHGLHSEQLQSWRADAMGALGTTAKTGKRTPEQREIRRLEREVRRKDKALAETTALLVLKKKFDALFGDEDSDMNPESDG
jgi:transposase